MLRTKYITDMVSFNLFCAGKLIGKAIKNAKTLFPFSTKIFGFPLTNETQYFRGADSKVRGTMVEMQFSPIFCNFSVGNVKL